MDGVHLPDTVLGLGGAGKKLVFETLRQQSGDGEYWFLEELMSERNEHLNRVNFFTIDSATVEVKDDRPKVREIENAIDDIKEQNRLDGIEYYPDVKHDYVNIGEDITRVYSNRDSFIHTKQVGERLAQTDLTHWWLEKDDLRSGLDFSEGVYRRRARSKGMYYAAKQGGQKVSEIVASARDQVALVTALGGGTGSGMSLDLAREINEDGVEVTLFAVIPNSEEDSEKRANAHAALSELEYLQLTDQNPFTQIVLLPFEPVADNNDPKAYEDEFVDSFLYTFLSFYNLNSNIRHDSLECSGSNYHPFTVAVPQLIRYNTAHIKQAENDLEVFLEDKAAVLEQELQLYDALERFLVENYDDASAVADQIENNITSIPEDSKVGPRGRNILQRRFDDLQTLVELEVFDQLDYKSPAEFEPVIEGAVETDGTVVDQVRDLEHQISLQAPRNNVPEDVPGKDIKLADVLEEEIEAVIKKARVLELSERIDDESVRDNLVRDVNRPTDSDETGGHERLDAQRKEARQEKQRTQEEADELEETIDSSRERIASQVDELESDVSEPVSQLELLTEQESELLSGAADVDAELDRIQTQINSAGDPDEVKRITFDYDLSEFDVLEEIGLDGPPADETDMSRAVGYMTKARTHALKQDAEDGNFVESITGKAKQWLDGDDAHQQEKYEGYISSLRKQSPAGADQIGTLPRWDRRDQNIGFELSFEAAVERQLADRRTSLLAEIADAYTDLIDDLADTDELDEGVRQKLQSVSPSADDIETTLSGDHESLFDEIQTELVDVSLTHLEAQHAELEEEVDTYAHKADAYRKAIEFYYEHNDLTDYATDEQELRNQLETIGVDETEPGLSDDYRYIKRKDPSEVYQALGADDIRDSDFWERERRQIENEIQNNLIGTNVCESNRFLRLQATGNDLISDDQSTRRSGYNEHGIFPVFMSRLFDDDKDVSFDIRNEFSDFNLNAGQGENNQYEETITQNGGPWDIAATVFVGGVFLDNLREMQGGAGSYPRAYEYQKDNGSDPVRLHHSWGLGGEDISDITSDDGGMYVRRDGTMNLAASQADDPSVRLDQPPVRFLNNAADDEIIETILSEYMDVQEFTLDHGYNTSQADE